MGIFDLWALPALMVIGIIFTFALVKCIEDLHPNLLWVGTALFSGAIEIIIAICLFARI